jgi:hypothetical protein
MRKFQRAAIPIMSIGVMALVTAWWLHRSKLNHRSHAIVQTADRRDSCKIAIKLVDTVVGVIA